jgi:hypothetical protein
MTILMYRSFSIANPVYDKNAALRQDAQVNARLQRLGEVYSITNSPSWENMMKIFSSADQVKHRKWLTNDENIAKRQITKTAAFFHFRHWDDYSSKR